MASKGGVHLSYLVVAVVICLGLVGVVYFQNTEIEKAKSGKSKAEGERDKAVANHKKSIQELTQARRLLIGPDGEDSAPDYEGLTALLAKAGEELAKSDAARTAQAYVSMQEYVMQSFPVIQNWRERFETQVAQAQAEASRTEAAMAAKGDLERITQDTEKDLRDKNNDVTVRLEKTLSDAEAMEQKLREDREEREDELTAEIANLTRRNRIESNLRKRAENRLEHLLAERVQEKDFDKVDPDGEIVQVSEELGFAWIDLGRNHRLEAGTVFDVFQFIKGGRRETKGKVEVVKVDANMAQVSIVALADELNPLLPGDKVASPFYSPDDKPIFVLAGSEMSSRRLSVDELKRRIIRFGGILQDGVSIKTDYVVCLKGFGDSDEYRDARQLGVTVLGEDQILGFLGQ